MDVYEIYVPYYHRCLIDVSSRWRNVCQLKVLLAECVQIAVLGE